jgi:perosamine synthetase
MHDMQLTSGDEVIVPAITFVATANAVIFCRGTPVFADVQPDSLLIDAESVESRITPKTRGIVAIDYAGQPCDYDELRRIADRHRLFLVADGCHALGADYRGNRVGAIADLTTFSFHPVKHITTGEGGMVTTNDASLVERMRRFCNHGITTDHRARSERGEYFYEMTDLGFNYRLSDFQCALGISQLKKLPLWLERRRWLARSYDAHFLGENCATPLKNLPDRSNAYHLYVVKIRSGRDRLFRSLRERGIGANVHYLPVYLHPFYRRSLGYSEGLCLAAEAAYKEILSLPLYPQMESNDVDYVAGNIKDLC